MIWRSLEYNWPEIAILLLLVFPIGCAFFYLNRYRKNCLKGFGKHLIFPRISGLFLAKTLLFCVAWICGVFALMQPKGNVHYIQETATELTRLQQVFLLIDTSASMNVADMPNGRTRFESAKGIADGIISRLQGESVALSAFTSVTLQITPSTTDYFFTRMMLNQLEINEEGTSGTDLKQLLEFVKKNAIEKFPYLFKTIIILSDGEETILDDLQGESAHDDLKSLLNPLIGIDTQSLRIITVAFGSESGGIVPQVTFEGKSVISKSNRELLSKIASLGNGSFYIANDINPLQIIEDIETSIQSYQESHEEKTQNNITKVYDSYDQIPLGIAILALGLCLMIPNTLQFRKKDLMLIAMMMLHLPLDAKIDHLSVNIAKTYYDAGDYTQANREYTLLLKSHMETWEKAIFQYNLGTTLLMEGKPNEALVYFLKADQMENSLPLLRQRLTINMTLAYLSLPIDIRVIRSIFSNIEDATFANCELAFAEGATICKSSSIIDEMRSQAIHILNEYQTSNQQSDFKSLLIQYQWVSIENPLKEASLILLEKIQTTYADQNQDQNAMLIAQNNLKASINAIHDGRELTARMYLEIAANGLMDLEFKPNGSSETILKQGISEQDLGLKLNRLSLLAEQRNIKETSAMDLLKDTQQHVLQIIEGFLKAAVNEQKLEFSKSVTILPWEEIILLFTEGRQAAIEASNFTQQPIENLKRMRVLQNLALSKWKEALLKFHQSEKQTFSQETAQHMNQKKQLEINDVLRTLQEMEFQDHSEPQLNRSPSQQLIKRPW